MSCYYCTSNDLDMVYHPDACQNDEWNNYATYPGYNAGKDLTPYRVCVQPASLQDAMRYCTLDNHCRFFVYQSQNGRAIYYKDAISNQDIASRLASTPDTTTYVKTCPRNS